MTTTMMTTLVVFLRLEAFLCREALHSQLGGGCDDFHNVPFRGFVKPEVCFLSSGFPSSIGTIGARSSIGPTFAMNAASIGSGIGSGRGFGIGGIQHSLGGNTNSLAGNCMHGSVDQQNAAD